MTVRRALVAAALVAGAAAATSLSTSGPASASCGTVNVPGHPTYQVCNPVIEKVEDLLKPS